MESRSSQLEVYLQSDRNYMRSLRHESRNPYLIEPKIAKETLRIAEPGVINYIKPFIDDAEFNEVLLPSAPLFSTGLMSKNRERRKQYRSVHECMADLLGRDDLRRINQLGLWSFFASMDQVKRFASLPRTERRAFFDRFAKTLADKPSADEPSPISPADEDHRLFDLPANATVEQIHRRYRELALAFHPDRREGDTELMQEINLAYQRLLAKAGGCC